MGRSKWGSEEQMERNRISEGRRGRTCKLGERNARDKVIKADNLVITAGRHHTPHVTRDRTLLGDVDRAHGDGGDLALAADQLLLVLP